MRALYLSYDGMTDPLGASQVIPYLQGLAKLGHQVALVSFEKPERFERFRGQAEASLGASGIDWHPLRYHKKPPILSTLVDLAAMRRLAFELVRKKDIELVHCRSYVASLVGLSLKRRLGTRFVFDMRGFWADERVDGGLWDLDRLPYRLAYEFFKKNELSFINESDRTVSLTHAGKAEMLKWKIDPGAAGRIEVIPCCADLGHFDRAKVRPEDRVRLQAELGLSERDFVVAYLGSLGTWYLLDEMLAFFKSLLSRRPQAKLLFITPDAPDQVMSAARKAGIDPGAIRVRFGARAEVPALLSLSKLGLFFIKPSFSKISSSPTKLAEILAMGIPVVTNSGVGDMDWLASRSGVMVAMRDFGAAETERALGSLSALEQLPAERIRQVAIEHFALEKGVEIYQRIYQSCGQSCGQSCEQSREASR